MIEKFVETYTKKLATKPECIGVSSRDITEEDGSITREICVLAHSDDLGRLIGKEGRMIGSLKTLISGAKAKDGQNYKIFIQAINQ
ncbi:RNA-binding protein [Helicobacter sp. TUL]|uniref:KH domain-containing protein n=1 Tax=Helicobacter sp. TUL TaxID=1848928 RepID=UPI000BAB4934|nr:KH domain-containing protein [Helicobacter sp. TUL]PAU99483.1 RNA-binding protein [Helicobacter sp. TUL]